MEYSVSLFFDESIENIKKFNSHIKDLILEDGVIAFDKILINKEDRFSRLLKEEINSILKTNKVNINIEDMNLIEVLPVKNQSNIEKDSNLMYNMQVESP